jgi:uncharacterized membrane protein required for colicin V production
MARSGFRRGLVFYAIDLVGFVGAVVLAIRFHEIPAIVFDAFGLSARNAAIAGGLAIFVPLIVLTAIIGGRLSRAVFVPGLFTTNRVLGAAFAAALAVTIVVVGLLFARAAALPFGLSDLVERSLIAPRVLDAVAPATVFIDDKLGLDLCGGRLARAIPDLCDEPYASR